MAHTALYGAIREAILARHFALGRHWRANHFTNDNHFGEAPLPGADERIGCTAADSGPAPVRQGLPLFEHPTQLLEQSHLAIERWRVFRHERANPLMMTGLRLVSLAVEHRLGHAAAAPLVRTVLRTLDSLMKFQRADEGRSPFAGYILRWDPATTDDWTLRVDAKGVETPQLCCQFLINPDPKTFGDQHFLYCTPLDDPRYRRLLSSAISEPFNKGLLRRWEPSMDEYVGLVCGLFVVWHSFKGDTSPAAGEITSEVKRQLSQIAAYLRHVGYLLVRPCGGFVGNGASGANPALEFAISRIFHRVLGDAFAVPAENGFDDAIRKAGLWTCWRNHSPVDPQSLRAFIDGLQDNRSLRDLLGNHPLQTLANHFNDPNRLSATLAAAAAVDSRLDCIDVLSDEARLDFVVAAIVKQMAALSPRATFLLFMQAPLQEGNWADYFKPFLGLSALDDPDPTVAQAYLQWYRSYVGVQTNNPEEKETFGHERWGISVFATAVAVLLNGSDPAAQFDLERRLEAELQTMHDVLLIEAGGDLVLHDKDGGGGESHDKSVEGRSNWFGYLAPLSLAWLRKLRLSPHDRLLNITPLPAVALPVAAEIAVLWRRPVVPGAVIDAAHVDRMPIPLAALRRGVFPARGSGEVDLFIDPPPKPHDNSLGEVPAPQAVERPLEHASRSLFTRQVRHVLLPPPLLLLPGQIRADYALTWLTRVSVEQFIRARREALVNDTLVVELDLDNVAWRWRPPVPVLNNVRYAARYTLSWVRVP